MQRPGHVTKKQLWGFGAMTLLAIGLIDELVDGAFSAAWPAIRSDLDLSYLEIGLLLTLPGIVASVLEPIILIAGDLWRCHVLVIGGFFYALSLAVSALAGDFWVLLVAFFVLFPSNGAFVNLAQASLVDGEPKRAELNLARWAFVGSLGNTFGPLCVAFVVALGLDARSVFLVLALASAPIVFSLMRGMSFPRLHLPARARGSGVAVPINLLKRVRAFVHGRVRPVFRLEVFRSLLLLGASDLLLDVLRGFLGLYFVDVVRVGEQNAVLALGVFVGVGLLGDALVVPLLARVSGERWVRLGAVCSCLVYPLFLIIPSFAIKLVLLAMLALLNSGWYPVLQARLYASAPGKSGALLAVSSLFGFAMSGVPFLLGLLAEAAGLGTALWALLIGPLAIVLFLGGSLSIQSKRERSSA